MISSKKLTKWLFIADASVGCDICGGSTWESSLSSSQIYKEQLWHDSQCPLYARPDVFHEWSNESAPKTNSWRGRIKVRAADIFGGIMHTLWLVHDDGRESRLVASHDDFDCVDLDAFDGQEVTVLGAKTTYKSESTIYFSMLLDRRYL